MTAGGQSPRRVWLVRHGETEGQSSIRFHGTLPSTSSGAVSVSTRRFWGVP